MKPFEIILKNEKLKHYDRIALIIIIINLALFSYLAISSEIKSIRITAIVGGSLIITVLAIEYFLVYYKKIANSPYKAYAEYAVGFAWFQIGYWWIALLVFLLGTLYLISKRPLRVSVDKESITYPSFPKKKLSWPELNNIILKDGLLTIDFKNNKFIQQAVDETKSSVNEPEFNDFCREQLNK